MRRTRFTSVLAAATLSCLTLTGCLGDDNGKDSSGSSQSASTEKKTGPKVSVKQALASDATAAKACKDLLGDGSELGKAIGWPKVTVTGRLTANDKKYVECEVTNTSSDKWVNVLLINDDAVAADYMRSHADSDSESTTKVSGINREAGTTIFITRTPSTAKAGAEKQAAAMVERLMP